MTPDYHRTGRTGATGATRLWTPVGWPRNAYCTSPLQDKWKVPGPHGHCIPLCLCVCLGLLAQLSLTLLAKILLPVSSHFYIDIRHLDLLCVKTQSFKLFKNPGCDDYIFFCTAFHSGWGFCVWVGEWLLSAWIWPFQTSLFWGRQSLLCAYIPILVKFNEMYPWIFLHSFKVECISFCWWHQLGWENISLVIWS